MGFHVDLIQELPRKLLEGNTVVSQLCSVKSQKKKYTLLNGGDQTQLQRGNLELSSHYYQKVLYVYGFIKVHS